MNVLALSLKTIPDVVSGRRIYGFHDLSDHDVAAAMLHRRRQQTGRETLSLPLNRIVAIAAVVFRDGALQMWSATEQEAPEPELLEQLFAQLRPRASLRLVGWNSRHFDWPLLRYRALLHGVVLPGGWDDSSETLRLDLNSVMADQVDTAEVPFNDAAELLGLPTHHHLDDESVWGAWQKQAWSAIGHGNRVDALNLVHLYLRFALVHGHIDKAQLHDWHGQLMEQLRAHSPKYDDYLDAWSASANLR